MATLYLNNDAVVKFTNKLEQLNKTTLPNLVRETLNAAALDVKQKTMPESATVFKHRMPNFWSHNSRVEYCKKTHNINEMVSSVGFSSGKLNIKETNFAVRDLEQQEDGGEIHGRTFIPLPIARGGSMDSPVKNKYRLTEINKLVINSATFKGKTAKEKFTLAAIFVGKGGFVIGNGLDRTFIFQINSVHRVKKSESGKTGWTVINKTPIYAVKAQRVVNVPETNFMAIASNNTSKKLEDIYINLAKARIEKGLQSH